MIEPVFNEYSAIPLCSDESAAKTRLNTLACLLKRLKSYGVSRIRYENSLYDIPFLTGVSLGKYCADALINRSKENAEKINNAQLLFSLIKKPYVKPGEKDVLAGLTEVKYLKKTKDSSEEIDCPICLLVAYKLNTFTVGFDNNIESPCRLSIKQSAEDNDAPPLKSVDVIFICRKDDCDNDKDFIKLMASQKDLVVPIVDISEKQKKTSVPGHHGRTECNEHGDELLKSPYVKRVLNSLHFDSSDKNYISRVNDDLSIEIRLHWTTKGHGIVISTSAKDLVHAHWIANLLKEKYDRK